MKNFVTLRVELDNGTVIEKREEIERIGNRAFLVHETRNAIHLATYDIAAMLCATEGSQTSPEEA